MAEDIPPGESSSSAVLVAQWRALRDRARTASEMASAAGTSSAVGFSDVGPLISTLTGGISLGGLTPTVHEAPPLPPESSSASSW